ncbi:haloacid dehalogenase-like hydrolase [uncultured Cellulomonas sp.]|uniref:haloacid dehalogenase-like hydrolase n=1 Tax=uncultured Cellulomonas sp. TaxID=189682 RepID=UPI00260F4A4D|nr:haloacid dehalogenase-like hydrolase [uncultured Cellulomonas sp.]
MPDARTGVLATDLDGTVVDVNTFPHFVRFLTRRLVAARRPVALARLVAAGGLRRLHVVSHHGLKRVVCELGATLPPAEVAEWARLVLAEHGHPEVVETVRGWTGRALLTTAAPQVYAVHLAALLGITEVHASHVRGGALLNNEGPEKVRQLALAGLDRVEVFLTDDMVIDRPMAQVADRVLEVGPGGRIRTVDLHPGS